MVMLHFEFPFLFFLLHRVFFIVILGKLWFQNVSAKVFELFLCHFFIIWVSNNSTLFQFVDFSLEGYFSAMYFFNFFLKIAICVDGIRLVEFRSNFLTNVKFFALNGFFFIFLLKTFAYLIEGIDNLYPIFFLDLLTRRNCSVPFVEHFLRFMPFEIANCFKTWPLFIGTVFSFFFVTTFFFWQVVSNLLDGLMTCFPIHFLELLD